MATKKKNTVKKTVSKKAINEVEDTIIKNPSIKEEGVLAEETEKVDEDEMEKVLEAVEETKEEATVEEELKKKIDDFEVINGDPSVVSLVEEIQDKAMAETFKEEETKPTRILDSMFGYSWNGMEMDY